LSVHIMMEVFGWIAGEGDEAVWANMRLPKQGEASEAVTRPAKSLRVNMVGMVANGGVPA